MSAAISDEQVVAVLRPLVRSCGPVLDFLREAGSGTRPRPPGVTRAPHDRRARLLGALHSVRVPGTAAWARMDPQARTRWWINRLGRFTAVLAAVPGLGGALADRLPIQEALGAAGQALLLCAIAGERGVLDPTERVRLLAWVLFERDVDPEVAAGRRTERDRAAEDARTAELTERLDRSTRRRGRITVRAAWHTAWRLGRSLLAIGDELEKRPRGHWYHQALGMVPLLGVVGAYLGERSGLRRAARRADRWLTPGPA